MEIPVDLALAKRLVRHLTTVLSDDWVAGLHGLDIGEAEDDLIALARLVWEAEEAEGG